MKVTMPNKKYLAHKKELIKALTTQVERDLDKYCSFYTHIYYIHTIEVPSFLKHQEKNMAIYNQQKTVNNSPLTQKISIIQILKFRSFPNMHM